MPGDVDGMNPPCPPYQGGSNLPGDVDGMSQGDEVLEAEN